MNLSGMMAHQQMARAESGQDYPLRVLGVDPAAAGPTGYGVIESDGRNCRLLHYGALRIAPQRRKESLGAALQDVHALLCKLIADFSPHVLAVEGIFSALNVRTALQLAEVRGVVLLAAEQFGVELYSYSPREVKACVAGYGQADKRQMQTMVGALLHMKELPEPSDAADALAVALCHLRAEVLERRYGLPRGKKAKPRVPRIDVGAVAAIDATPLRRPGIQSNR
jgi:crossover junction endodeoxyribonuclease RuvC